MTVDENNLYNEKIKNEYLKRVSDRALKSSILFFKRIAIYEDVFYKDFYEMTVDEIVFVVQETLGVNYVEYESLKPYFRIIKSYLNWACECNYTKKNISTEVIEKLEQPHCVYCEKTYRYKFVKNEEDFLELMDYLFPPDWVNSSTVNLRLYVTMLLLFNGIPLNDIGLILKSNVDFDNKEISFVHQSDNKTYTIKMLNSFISKYKIMLKVSQLDVLDSPNKNMTRKREIKSDFFMAMSGEPSKFSSTYDTKIRKERSRLNELLKRNKLLMKPIVFKHEFVYWNGLLYRMYLSMVTGVDYCIDLPNRRNLNLDEVFQDFYDVFYNENSDIHES